MTCAILGISHLATSAQSTTQVLISFERKSNLINVDFGLNVFKVYDLCDFRDFLSSYFGTILSDFIYPEYIRPSVTLNISGYKRV